MYTAKQNERSNKKDFAVVDSLAELQGLSGMRLGATIEQKGYTTSGDFGEPITRKVETASGGIDSVTMADGLSANLYTNKPINVMWFGITNLASGATDDGAIFQNILDLIATLGGGSVYFPAGDYRFVTHDNAGGNEDVIVLPSNIEMFGDGDNSVVTFGARLGVPSINSTYSRKNIHIHDLKIQMENVPIRFGTGNFDKDYAYGGSLYAGDVTKDTIEYPGSFFDGSNEGWNGQTIKNILLERLYILNSDVQATGQKGMDLSFFGCQDVTIRDVKIEKGATNLVLYMYNKRFLIENLESNYGARGGMSLKRFNVGVTIRNFKGYLNRTYSNINTQGDGIIDLYGWDNRDVLVDGAYIDQGTGEISTNPAEIATGEFRALGPDDNPVGTRSPQLSVGVRVVGCRNVEVKNIHFKMGYSAGGTTYPSDGCYAVVVAGRYQTDDLVGGTGADVDMSTHPLWPNLPEYYVFNTWTGAAAYDCESAGVVVRDYKVTLDKPLSTAEVSFNRVIDVSRARDTLIDGFSLIADDRIEIVSDSASAGRPLIREQCENGRTSIKNVSITGLNNSATKTTFLFTRFGSELSLENIVVEINPDTDGGTDIKAIEVQQTSGDTFWRNVKISGISVNEEIGDIRSNTRMVGCVIPCKLRFDKPASAEARYRFENCVFKRILPLVNTGTVDDWTHSLHAGYISYRDCDLYGAQIFDSIDIDEQLIVFDGNTFHQYGYDYAAGAYTPIAGLSSNFFSAGEWYFRDMGNNITYNYTLDTGALGPVGGFEYFDNAIRDGGPPIIINSTLDVVTDASTHTIPNGSEFHILDFGGGVTSATINMAAAPYDGQTCTINILDNAASGVTHQGNPSPTDGGAAHTITRPLNTSVERGESGVWRFNKTSRNWDRVI